MRWWLWSSWWKKEEDGEVKLELVEEAKADEDDEKDEFDAVAEQYLPDGESERSTGPLDLVLEDEVAIAQREREREREGFFFFDFSKEGPRPVGLANLTSLKGWIYRSGIMGCMVNSGKFSGWFGVFAVGLVKLTMVYLTRGWVGNIWLGFSSNGCNDVDSANRRKLEAVCLTTFMGCGQRLPRIRF
jgi:hypothetical protein